MADTQHLATLRALFYSVVRLIILGPPAPVKVRHSSDPPELLHGEHYRTSDEPISERTVVELLNGHGKVVRSALLQVRVIKRVFIAVACVHWDLIDVMKYDVIKSILLCHLESDVAEFRRLKSPALVWFTTKIQNFSFCPDRKGIMYSRKRRRLAVRSLYGIMMARVLCPSVVSDASAFSPRVAGARDGDERLAYLAKVDFSSSMGGTVNEQPAHSLLGAIACPSTSEGWLSLADTSLASLRRCACRTTVTAAPSMKMTATRKSGERLIDRGQSEAIAGVNILFLT